MTVFGTDKQMHKPLLLLSYDSGFEGSNISQAPGCSRSSRRQLDREVGHKTPVNSPLHLIS